MKYRWILFDADGTLFDYDKAESAALEAAFAASGLLFEAGHVELYRGINGRIWQQLERGEIAREELKAERFRQLFEAAGLAADPAAFSDLYLASLAARSDLLDGAEDLVRALHGKVGLVLITNGIGAVQRPRLAGSSIDGYFDPVVISEDVGSAKPDPGIFDATFARIGNPSKADVLIVGDSLTSDIRGGSDYGIDTCWYNPARVPRDVDITVRYEIRSLHEVAGIVGLG